MGTSFFVSDTAGNGIGNATISCGGCQVVNGGSGFYWVSTNLLPGQGAIVVAAPGKVPTVLNWFTHAAQGGKAVLYDPVPATSKW